jgi:hypothetical protein
VPEQRPEVKGSGGLAGEDQRDGSGREGREERIRVEERQAQEERQTGGANRISSKAGVLWSLMHQAEVSGFHL